ncbi:putative amidohydrolase protein [Phaeoacremonium minimum UCRPA7]|uniref:Putative amidohydrolase protein n=1 Tax=Phaeoacremonium minimum (strain UCR-PA7) TaxID=1286976 RepID=R8B9Y2_PHAM7|nr:putative amidohydrolase protein [Phaeoacremonium minimum UCRPA7]EON96087.1 putative amidohydrolase protein [Phaeoacremonium minimum UCRPA7]
MSPSIEQDWELVPSATDTNAASAVRSKTNSSDLGPQRIYSTSLGIAIRTRPANSEASLHAKITTKKKFFTIIKAGLLIPGDGEPFSDAALVVENKVIAWVGAEANLPQKYIDAPHRSFSVPYLMPGLWECHAHFAGDGPGNDGDSYVGFLTLHPSTGGARLARGCWEAIQRGYTSMRDVAGYGCEVAKAIEDGTIVGPNVYSSGSCLSQTAGHGDIFPLPAGDVLLNFGVSNITPGHFATGMTIIVDGVDECRRAVRLQIRRGAKCIKILASGGVMSRDDNPLYAQFSPEELECIVSEASRQGRSVAAHVHGKPGILAAVKAGVTTVEHVSFADKECIDLIKEKGTIYVATRFVLDMLIQSGGEGLTKESWEKAKLCATNHLTAYKMAIEAGIPLAMGTDTPPGFNQAVELEHAVKAGLSNLEAIKAATANGPLTVGAQAPKTGQLKAGYEADLLGLTENPVEDVKVLQNRDIIQWVWKGGKIFKGPGIGPWGEE